MQRRGVARGCERRRRGGGGKGLRGASDGALRQAGRLKWVKQSGRSPSSFGFAQWGRPSLAVPKTTGTLRMVAAALCPGLLQQAHVLLFFWGGGGGVHHARVPSGGAVCWTVCLTMRGRPASCAVGLTMQAMTYFVVGSTMHAQDLLCCTQRVLGVHLVNPWAYTWYLGHTLCRHRRPYHAVPARDHVVGLDRTGPIGIKAL